MLGVAVALGLLVGCSSDSEGGESKAQATTTTKDGQSSASALASGSSTTEAGPIDPERPPSSDDYAAGMVILITGSTPLGRDEQARVEDCLAPAWVEIIGVDTFVEKDLAPGDLSGMDGGLETMGLDQQQAVAMMDAFDSCQIDVRAAVVEQIVANPSLDEAAKACIEAKVTIEAVRESFIANLTGQEAPGGSFTAAQDCVADASS